MNITNLNAVQFKDMIIAAGKQLEDNVDLINELNVYPVPDGDTGINMHMTFQSGVDSARTASDDDVSDVASALGKGLLMGARGNSGVILSQIFRGFHQAIEGKTTLNTNEFAGAFAGAVDAAYRAVMKPAEGTILTVVRESADAGVEASKTTDNIVDVMQAIVDAGRIALDKTPDMLPILKQVGVVDSGGKGLLCIYEGFLSALTGEVIISADEKAPQEDSGFLASVDDELADVMDVSEIEYGYCTEIMVRLGEGAKSDEEFDYDKFRSDLSEIGDSLLVIADDEIVKVHVHAENPGKVLQLGQQYGELIKIKVDNMREQVRGRQDHAESIEKEPYAIITVAAGDGVRDLFLQSGASYVIEGGQTMNPSTQDFIDAIDKVNAEKIIILPNNKNIQMAAEQAASVAEVETAVIPTRSIPQGLVALLGFNPTVELSENVEAMTEMVSTVKSGQITYAIRDSEIDGINVKKDDYMGLLEGTIVVSDPEISKTFHSLINQMVDAETEIVTIIVGEDGDMDLAEEIADEVEKLSEFVECEIVQGSQPVYPFIISVE